MMKVRVRAAGQIEAARGLRAKATQSVSTTIETTASSRRKNLHLPSVETTACQMTKLMESVTTLKLTKTTRAGSEGTSQTTIVKMTTTARSTVGRTTPAAVTRQMTDHQLSSPQTGVVRPAVTASAQKPREKNRVQKPRIGNSRAKI